MEENKRPEDGKLSIELTEEIADGIYSNLAVISHSHAEFVFDFIKILPNTPKAKVKSRIIMTPSHAKRLMAALKDNINKFEAQHGVIKDVDNAGTAFPLNFGGPTGQA